jgi:hypothetical protein
MRRCTHLMVRLTIDSESFRELTNTTRVNGGASFLTCDLLC